LFHDALALAAYDKGLVRRPLTRLQVAKGFQDFQTQVLKQSHYNFPVVCPLKQDYQHFLNYSLAMEERLLPHFYHSSPDGYEAHVENFWNSVDKKKYCWIDTESILNDKMWRSHLEQMQNQAEIR